MLLSIFTAQSLQAADLKVGYVNTNTISQKLPQSKAIIKNIQNEFAEKFENLKKLDADIKALQAKGQKEGPTMAASALTDLKREMEKKISQLKLGDTNLKEDIQKRQKEEFLKLNVRIGQAIEAIAKRDNYDLLLYKSSILYVSQKITDVSEDVIKIMTDPKAN
jgi:outer membrane protein